MSNAFDGMRAAMSEAREVMRAADIFADQMADMIADRLKHVSGPRLSKLKRELRRWDIHRREWKE
ncbi:MAG: hypothetical protein WC736_15140 [Gallionella sp.]|jgi:hypothetical protein